MADFDNIWFPPDMPEDLKQAIKNKYSHNQMQELQHSQQFMRILRESDRDTLATLRWLFHACIDGDYTAAHYEGMVTASIISRFKWCSTCGGDHDFHLTDDMSQMEEKQLPDPAQELPSDPESPDKQESTLTRVRRLMNEYRLSRHYDGSICCRDCGYPYPSLEDRMLKPPDICPGCFQKSAFG